MARVKRGVQVRQRHKKVIKQAKGFHGRSKNCYRIALRRLEKSWQYAYRDRKVRKRDFRSLWIQRINAAVRSFGLVYSVFMKGLKAAGVDVNRKVLSELAISQPSAFGEIVNKAKAAL
ncbi:50S ribosomal protein L20 [Neorickettsia sennetsu]|uniref:Large ribosomal subunit protein bL20 n=1 Tax=Ehrlichia sennetsu (strain ATCC VR-367 / Miyayama) TaxID=222891 RepID=RL20_EHRS3|nr:50S ribosomal protein L20 [Neorickettsia sennetsu]Q2GEI6.1 RecName: Full=Large ribosomal subunit protein bL20; AltName: Full=50S ribosomal protein L20 [Neorickettsia sennetsu str. Miyayama]ABD46220.1 ribosomal protein L20 [Neorickettsia sennetsu str. Miyayama]